MYLVHGNGGAALQYDSLREALRVAKGYDDATIVRDGHQIWPLTGQTMAPWRGSHMIDPVAVVTLKLVEFGSSYPVVDADGFYTGDLLDGNDATAYTTVDWDESRQCLTNRFTGACEAAFIGDPAGVVADMPQE